jgi:ATP citrate (pro-S)-lyase
VAGVLQHFLGEPFVPHDMRDEYYLCLQTHRGGDEILFTHEGGVEVGDVDSKGLRLAVPLETDPCAESVAEAMLGGFI